VTGSDAECAYAVVRRGLTAEGGPHEAGLATFVGQHVVEYGLLMAASVLSLLPIALFFLLIQRRFVEGIATTGIK